MKNPWPDLPTQAPYALKGELEVIEAFNWTARPGQRVHTNVLPQPYLGDPEAPVVLLNLNPRYSPEDEYTHAAPNFLEAWRKCLLHEPQEYPFYLLNPRLPGAGFHWWIPKLRALTDRFSRESIANRLFCVEGFPYHTDSWVQAKQDKLRVPSQDYSAELVRRSMERDAVILLLRGRPLWDTLVPELVEYPLFFELANPRNPYISYNNCPEGFPSIIEALSQE